ncbi:MAG: RNA polymerase sigma factor [Clostridia bacterium]|nr:RNA polymerase sigma factor [Clostridia bacterium]
MNDEMIVALYWARSEEAIAETDRAYGKYCRTVAYGILRNDEDAVETVNDTYLKAWNSIPPHRPNPLKAFLAKITRHLSINRLEEKKAKKRGGGQYALVLDELAECLPDRNESDPTDALALQDTLNRFLKTLPLEARQIFVLRYWHLASIEEIAKKLSVGESKIKSALMRTRDKLKKTLREEGFFV